RGLERPRQRLRVPPDHRPLPALLAHPLGPRRHRTREYDRPMAHAAALVDEIANELDTWPGVHTEGLTDGAAVIRYEELELGVLDRDRGVAELRFSHPVRAE